MFVPVMIHYRIVGEETNILKMMNYRTERVYTASQHE